MQIKAYGYNTPENQITNKGPFEYWPIGYFVRMAADEFAPPRHAGQPRSMV